MNIASSMLQVRWRTFAEDYLITPWRNIASDLTKIEQTCQRMFREGQDQLMPFAKWRLGLR